MLPLGCILCKKIPSTRYKTTALPYLVTLHQHVQRGLQRLRPSQVQAPGSVLYAELAGSRCHSCGSATTLTEKLLTAK